MAPCNPLPPSLAHPHTFSLAHPLSFHACTAYSVVSFPFVSVCLSLDVCMRVCGASGLTARRFAHCTGCVFFDLLFVLLLSPIFNAQLGTGALHSARLDLLCSVRLALVDACVPFRQAALPSSKRCPCIGPVFAGHSVALVECVCMCVVYRDARTVLSRALRSRPVPAPRQA